MIDEMLYWLFSSIAQAYGAIVGFVGLLVVYRLENQNRLRESIRDRLLDSQRMFAGTVLPPQGYGWSPEQISLHFRNLMKTGMDMAGKNPLAFHYWCNQVDEIDKSVALGARIRDKFKSFIAFHIPLIVGSILVIFFVPSISGIGRDFDLKVTVFVVLAGALGVSVFQTWRFFKTLIQ